MVLDLDRAAVIKACTAPTDEAYERWTADVPGKGLTLEWEVLDSTKQIYRGISLDPTVPCDQSYAAVDPKDVRYIVAHGSFGIGNTEARDGINAAMDSNGNLLLPASTKTPIPFGPQIPYALRAGLNLPLTSILINNPQILVVRLAQDAATGSQFLALRKSDSTWHRIPVQSDWYDRLRGFDNFVAVVEGRVKKTIAAQRGRAATFLGRKDESGDESAGSKAWRKQPSRTGPDKEDFFLKSAAVYPGRLHLYDVNTERLYTIATNQADSEILLVEDQTVYYRVSDRLYSAPVTEKGIGTARLLATGDLIQDAHWAFIKH